MLIRKQQLQGFISTERMYKKWMDYLDLTQAERKKAGNRCECLMNFLAVLKFSRYRSAEVVSCLPAHKVS